jgi:hypothetical protein
MKKRELPFHPRQMKSLYVFDFVDPLGITPYRVFISSVTCFKKDAPKRGMLNSLHR